MADEIVTLLRKAISGVGVRVRGDADEIRTLSPAIMSGAGAPSGDQDCSADMMIYMRNDAGSLATALYVTVDNGSTWAQWDAAITGETLEMQNETGGTLSKGTLVRLSGYSSSLPEAVVADADDHTLPATHVVLADIADGASGIVDGYALVEGIDTSGIGAAGDAMYLSTGATGGFTDTPPSGDAYVQDVGICVTKHATTGSAIMFPSLGIIGAIGESGIQAVSSLTEENVVTNGDKIEEAIEDLDVRWGDVKPVIETAEFTNPGAAGTNVVAQMAGDVDESTWGNITQPDFRRAVRVDFSAGWDGGDIEITGLSMTGDDTTETITASAGSVVEGVNGWSLIRRVRNLGTHGAGTADVEYSEHLAVEVGTRVPTLLEAYETSANGRDAGASITPEGVITTSAAPNGTLDWVISYSLADA